MVIFVFFFFFFFSGIHVLRITLIEDISFVFGFDFCDHIADKTSGQRLFEDFPELQQMFTLNKWVTFSDVTGALCHMSIPFSRLTNPIVFDMTEVFDEMSSEGNLLLDFFTHVSNFRKTADDGLVQRVLKFLKMKAEELAMMPLEQASLTTGNVGDRKESTGLKFKKIWETLIIEKR